MSDWALATLGELTQYQRAGGTPTATNPKYYGGDIPFVTIEDITRSRRELHRTQRSLTAAGLSASAAWVMHDRHILYSMYATVGKPVLNCIPCATNQAIIALKPNEKIDLEFLYYQLAFIEPSVYKFTSQTTQSNLNASSVRSLPISYPTSKASQQRIATILTSLDAAIEKTEALIEKHQQIKAGLMHDLFTRGVLPSSQLRPTTEQAPKCFKTVDHAMFPVDWQVEAISTVLDSVVDGPFGSNLKTEHYVVDAGVRVVRLQNISETEYDDSDPAYISARHAGTLARNKVVAGDVLIAGLGDDRYAVGRACCYPPDIEPAINKADCFRARCKPDAMRNMFLMLFLNSEVARQQMRRFEQGVTRPRVNTGNLKRLRVLVPSLAEQDRIIAKFENARSAIDCQRARLEKLRLEKLGLMQDLLTGRVAVQVPQPEAVT